MPKITDIIKSKVT